MRGSAGSISIAALVISGCAASGGERPEMAYLPPSSPPPVVPGAYVDQPRFLVAGNLADRLVQEGFEIESSGEDRIVAIYWGDPAPYVDCGWIVTYDDDGHDSMPAARGSATFERRRGGRIVDVEREMDLSAFLTVEMTPREGATVVRIGSEYALTKKALAADGAAPLDDETIRFATGEAAAFDIGTTCQPNGMLERLVLDALPSVTFSGSEFGGSSTGALPGGRAPTGEAQPQGQ